MKPLLTLFLLFSQLLLAKTQFTATMHNITQGKERIYKVYSDLSNYRYEFTEAGENGTVIVKPAMNKTFVLIPDKKYYQVSECDGSLSRMNDPWQTYLWFKNFGIERDAGTETINGITTKKRYMYQTETKVYTCWFSDIHNFPLKIINEIEPGTSMYLTDIGSWVTDSTFFTLPSGFIEVDRRLNPVVPEPPPPQTWEELSADIPYRGVLKRGQKIWITVREDSYYKIHVSNQTTKHAKFIYTLYRDGDPLPEEEQGMLKYRTFRLVPGQPKALINELKTGYEVLLEVYEGTLLVEIEKE